VCEFARKSGASPDPNCNRMFLCAFDPDNGSYWTERPGERCFSPCPDAAAIVEGAACDVGDAGAAPDGGSPPKDEDEAELMCNTPLGTCACTTGPDGAHSHPRTWVCRKPDDGCPATRPLLGAPCVGLHSCDYGGCDFKRGQRMICDNNFWQVDTSTCP
jgi:hypothetical protein